MRIDQMFESSSNKYLKAADLNGREVTLKIASLQMETFGKEADEKPVLSFDRTEKRLALNKTNARTIASMYGKESDGWIGKTITLFPTTTEYAGDMVACIRIRTTFKERAPQAAAAPASGPDFYNDQVPF
jgi:hypothetical protein